jgi:hypothetical protein
LAVTLSTPNITPCIAKAKKTNPIKTGNSFTLANLILGGTVVVVVVAIVVVVVKDEEDGDLDDGEEDGVPCTI